MINDENCLLADNSHEMTYFIFLFRKVGKMSQNLSSAAVVIGASRVKQPDKSYHWNRTSSALIVLSRNLRCIENRHFDDMVPLLII